MLPKGTRRGRLVAVLMLMPALSGPGGAGDLLDSVKARDARRFGVSEGLPGFSEPEAAGHWRGLDHPSASQAARAGLAASTAVRLYRTALD